MATEETCLTQICEMKHALLSEMHGYICGNDEMPIGKASAIIDMIKDLAMTEYYCMSVEAMRNHPDDSHKDSV